MMDVYKTDPENNRANCRWAHLNRVDGFGQGNGKVWIRAGRFFPSALVVLFSERQVIMSDLSCGKFAPFLN